MSLRNVLKVGLNIANAATASMIFELDSSKNEILLKEWFISKFLLRHLHKKGFDEVKRIYISKHAINIYHDVFGVIGVQPKFITFNQTESTIYFDIILIEDKLKNQLNKARFNAAVQGIAGGILAYCSFGFAGGSLIVDSIKEVSTAESDYALSKKCDFLGLGKSFCIPSPVILDPNTKLKDFLIEHGGELKIDLFTEDKKLIISAQKLTAHQIESIKTNLISIGKDLTLLGN